ncbi:LOW QUALITY PROTEIN: MATH domain and coiled-coil domain-containing protein At2g42460 [Capsella rubella]|uniref:LOW QUALITY PROTEIN: MATH domain and coiled-coil domain-containing protein At2g42460 n=1 Tax=Capsella rubella TaxID=81985 RepID=UPI000CD556BC|nr:LOW QUALITY PROTEIN: MATH domain and coiled-coil domain-containing protein At2g42460 [Capsella rubella]
MNGTELHKTFTWEIDNFTVRKFPIESTVFLSGGCEWYVLVRPKGDGFDDYLSLYLCVANPRSLQPGWKRRANLQFIILNQSGKEVHRTSERDGFFDAEIPGWGFRAALPLNKLQDKELLENNTLIIEVYTKVTEVVHQGDETSKEMVDFRGFNVLSSQVTSVSQIFAKYPNFAVDIKPKGRAVRTTYMKILLGLIKTVNQPPESFSETELVKAYSKLIDLMESGFKLDWLKSKLDEVSLERKKKIDADAARIQELEKKVKNLESKISDLEVEPDKEKAKSPTEPNFLWSKIRYDNKSYLTQRKKWD